MQYCNIKTESSTWKKTFHKLCCCVHAVLTEGKKYFMASWKSSKTKIIMSNMILLLVELGFSARDSGQIVYG